MFGKQIEPAAVTEVVARLLSDGKVVLGDSDGVSYNL
jgi:hypothetical protein